MPTAGHDRAAPDQQRNALEKRNDEDAEPGQPASRERGQEEQDLEERDRYEPGSGMDRLAGVGAAKPRDDPEQGSGRDGRARVTAA